MDKKLVKVTWLDAQASATNAYAEYEIPHAPIEINTLGWLLRQDEHGVSIANEWCTDATYRGLTFIPHGMIKAVEDIIKVPKKRKSRAKIEPEIEKPQGT